MSELHAVSLDDNPALDRPEHFAEAAQAFVGRCPGPLTAPHVAQALAYLARAGFIVSPAEHKRRCDEYAAWLGQVETAANDLVRRIHGGGE